MVKVSINIEMPNQVPEEQQHKDLMSKCCDFMDVCKSDDNSDYHMRYLQAIYNKLKQKRNLPEHLADLLEKLEEFMLTYDIDRVSLDAETMFKKNGDR